MGELLDQYKMKQQQRTEQKSEKEEFISVHPWLEGMVVEGAFGLFLFFSLVWFGFIHVF